MVAVARRPSLYHNVASVELANRYAFVRANLNMIKMAVGEENTFEKKGFRKDTGIVSRQYLSLVSKTGACQLASKTRSKQAYEV